MSVRSSHHSAALPPRAWWCLAVGVLLIAALAAAACLHNRARISGTTPRQRAASIGRIVDEGKPGAEEVVAGAVDDPEPKVREAAVVALGRLRYRSDLVRRCLRDPDSAVRYAAAATLGRMEGSSATDALTALLHNSDDTLARRGAVLGLLRIGTPEATYHIVRALDASDPKVQVAAMNAITARANIRWDTPPDPADSREWRRKVGIVRKFNFVRQAVEQHGQKSGR